VIKSAADTELMAGIRAVFKGRTLVDMDQSEAHGKGVLARPMINGRGERAAPLSHREQEVLELVARGYTNQEAANLLFLSVKTVETYRTRIAEKLGVRSRADIVRYAVEIGLLGPDKFQQERPIS
jgi:two-component system response regulator NreC